MKPIYLPVALLILLYGIVVGFMVYSSQALPEQVASHFGLHGQPNGWMPRTTYLAFMIGFGGLFPLFIVGICFAARYFPNSLINIPNREYWLAGERRQVALGYLFRHSLWFACIGIWFVGVLHWLVVYANQQVPIQLPLEMLIGPAICFAAAQIVWVLRLNRYFATPPTAST